jgi:phosphoribosylanthranilate isomerase
LTAVKICGVTLPDDAAMVATAGADYIGLNFWPKSKRFVEVERGPLLAQIARSAGHAKVVGVFVNADPDDVIETAKTVQLDAIQLHGDELPEDLAHLAQETGLPIWKAIATGTARDVEHLDQWGAQMILLDTPSAARGGAGKPFDWALAREARTKFPAQPLVLAGGLDPQNVAVAIAQVAPDAVDVTTGVEVAPGVKDAAKVAAFIAAVRAMQ